MLKNFILLLSLLVISINASSHRHYTVKTKIGQRFLIKGPVGHKVIDLFSFVVRDATIRSYNLRIEDIRRKKVALHCDEDRRREIAWNGKTGAYNIANKSRRANRIVVKRKPSWVSKEHDNITITLHIVNNSYIDVKIYTIGYDSDATLKQEAVLIRKGNKIFCKRDYEAIEWDPSNLEIDFIADAEIFANSNNIVESACDSDEKCIGYFVNKAPPGNPTPFVGKLITGLKGHGGATAKSSSSSFFIDKAIVSKYNIDWERKNTNKQYGNICKNLECTCIG